MGLRSSDYFRSRLYLADGLIEDYAHYGRGEAATVSNAVQNVTGHRARSFAAFARDYKQAFVESS